MRKGFIPIALAAAHLGEDETRIVARAKKGELATDNPLAPKEVTLASVQRVLQSKQTRWGQFAQNVAHIETGLGVLEALGQFYAAGAVTFASEESGADGGFLVPPDYRDAVLTPFAEGQFNLPALCEQFPTPSNTFSAAFDRRPYHDVQAHLVGEGDPIPQSKPLLESVTAKMGKLAVIIPVSDELLEDAPSLGAYMVTAAQGAMVYAATEAIIRGRPGLAVGIIECGALIAVPGEGSQTADTITAANVAAALSRVAAESLPTTIALAHPDAHEWILKLAMSGEPVPNLYSAADELAPAGRIAGRPLIVTEACSRLGDIGDLIFMDPRQYMVVTKDPQSRAMTSLHMFFDQSISAFRLLMRFAGLPMWAAPVQSRDSEAFRSPYVAIAERAG